MKDFKVGDKVICLTHGKGVVSGVIEDEAHNFNVICEFGNVGAFYSINGKSPLCKGRMLYHADEPLKAVTYDPIEIPHISNAMKAINWLDKGKKIIADTFCYGEVYCLKDESGHIICHDIDTGLANDMFTIKLCNIFAHNWYEYKKQYKCGFIQAIKAYKKDYKVKLNDYTLHLNVHDEFVLLNKEDEEIPLDNCHLISKDWEVFD